MIMIILLKELSDSGRPMYLRLAPALIRLDVTVCHFVVVGTRYSIADSVMFTGFGGVRMSSVFLSKKPYVLLTEKICPMQG